MTIARPISRLLVAAGFAVSSLAIAQGKTETPAPEVAPQAAAPQAAAPEGDAAPDAFPISVLWPDFQVGQHVVLEMSYLDTKKAPKPVTATVNIEVIDKTDDVFTIRWKASNARVPAEFTPMYMAPFHTIWDGTAGPTLEILVQEDVGVLGLQNWEAARDEALASARVVLSKIREKDGTPVAPETVDALLASFAAAALPTEDAVDVTLLKNVRPYFDGSYHAVEPGASVNEAIEIPWAFGGDGSAMLPMDRTTTLVTITTDPAPVYELSINIKPDDAKFKELMKDFTAKMADNIKGEQVDKIANSTIEHKVRWRLDTAKGWPTRVSSTTRLVNGGDVTTQTTTFTLVEGPTMKAKDAEAPANDIAPARSDTP